MECNKEGAIRALEIAEKRLISRDYAGAKEMALKAEKLFPQLDNISQLLTVSEVHCSSQLMANGLYDLYKIIQVEPTSDEILIKKQYRKLALLLHPDKNKFPGAEAAFKLVAEANNTLSDRAKRIMYDVKRKRVGRGKRVSADTSKPTADKKPYPNHPNPSSQPRFNYSNVNLSRVDGSQTNWRREISHGKQSTKPIRNFQYVTNHGQPYQNFAPEKHAHIQRNPPTRPNLVFVLPQTAQSGSQMRPNYSIVSPNSGYPVQAIGSNIFVSGPSSHQWGNGFNRQVPQQETYHRWGPQRQVNCGYNVHGSSHYERRNAPHVSRQMCKFYMQGRCLFDQTCKFRHE